MSLSQLTRTVQKEALYCILPVSARKAETSCITLKSQTVYELAGELVHAQIVSVDHLLLDDVSLSSSTMQMPKVSLKSNKCATPTSSKAGGLENRSPVTRSCAVRA